MADWALSVSLAGGSRHEGWHSQNWSPPTLHESVIPYNKTLWELRMIDLFPEEVMEHLKKRFGQYLDSLTHTEHVWRWPSQPVKDQ